MKRSLSIFCPVSSKIELAVSLIENIQREDLNAIEEAMADYVCALYRRRRWCVRAHL